MVKTLATVVVDIRVLGIMRDSGGKSLEGGLGFPHVHVGARDLDPRLDERRHQVYRGLKIFFCAFGITAQESVAVDDLSLSKGSLRKTRLLESSPHIQGFRFTDVPGYPLLHCFVH